MTISVLDFYEVSEKTHDFSRGMRTTLDKNKKLKYKYFKGRTCSLYVKLSKGGFVQNPTTLVVGESQTEGKGEAKNAPLSSNGTIIGILAEVDGKRRELVAGFPNGLKTLADIKVKDFEKDSFIGYKAILNLIKGEQGGRLRESWRLSDEDFKELPFELYLCLVREHSTCGILKKLFLIMTGLIKFCFGRFQ